MNTTGTAHFTHPARCSTTPLGSVLPRPTSDEPVAHGYTLTQVNGMAVFAARQCNWVNGMALTYRAEVAWSAIVEHLHTAYHPPKPGDLIAS